MTGFPGQDQPLLKVFPLWLLFPAGVRKRPSLWPQFHPPAPVAWQPAAAIGGAFR